MGCGASSASTPIAPVELEISKDSKADLLQNQKNGFSSQIQDSCIKPDPKAENLVIEGMHIDLSKAKSVLPIQSKVLNIECLLANDLNHNNDSEESGRSTDMMSHSDDLEDLDGKTSTLGASLRFTGEEIFNEQSISGNPRRLIIENVGNQWIHELTKQLERVVSIDEIELSGCEVRST